MIAITYSTDTTIEQIIRKGNFDDIRDEIESYAQLDNLLLLTGDSLDCSDLFDRVTHIPCGFQIPRPFRWLLFYVKAFHVLSSNKDQIGLLRAFGVGCPHAVLFCVVFGKPVIVSFEYDWSEQLVLAGRRVLASLARILEKSILRHSTVVICLTERLCEKARSRGAKRTICLPNSVDLGRVPILSSEEKIEIRSHIRAEEKKVILFVGRLHSIKRIGDLLEAFSILLKRRSDLVLVVIGEGPEKERLRHLTEELEISKGVRFLGAINRSLVMKYMQVADVFVLPSEMEGNPKVLLEAMAAKIPIVASDVVGINDLLEDESTGLLVKPRSPQQLADAVDKVFSNADFAVGMAERAHRMVVDDFDRAKISKSTLALVSSLLPEEASNPLDGCRP